MRQVPMKIQDFAHKKKQAEKISMITCYDYPSACTVSESNIDCVLVGDSVAMAVHGHNSTVMATMEMMELHTAAVARGLKMQFLISDLPFLSNRISREHTIINARKLIQAGAHAVKIEGADDDVCNTIQYLVTSGIPVMGHIGLTPQSIHQLGGYRIQGKTEENAADLLKQAIKLQNAGCFSLVIECVPTKVATTISQSLDIPTIGIGAGPQTDGQVLVWHDMLGLQSKFKPRFVKQFHAGEVGILGAINDYANAVQNVQFPAAEHQY